MEEINGELLPDHEPEHTCSDTEHYRTATPSSQLTSCCGRSALAGSDPEAIKICEPRRATIRASRSARLAQSGRGRSGHGVRSGGTHHLRARASGLSNSASTNVARTA